MSVINSVISTPEILLAILAVASLCALAFIGGVSDPKQEPTVTVNPYGDELKSVLQGFGSDVSSQRREPFELEMLDYAAGRAKQASQQLVALDLFSGYCAANGHWLAYLGYLTFAVDFSPPSKSLSSKLDRPFSHGGILHYFQSDVRKISYDVLLQGKKLDIVTGQRGLHFLRYAEARELVSKLASLMNPGGSMFFSIGAVDCKVGDGYKHADLPVADRWCPLEPELGGPIHVTEPLCLYKEEDVCALFADLGGLLVRLDRDDFGLFIVEFRKN
jgi:hypothetical protein